MCETIFFFFLLVGMVRGGFKRCQLLYTYLNNIISNSNEHTQNPDLVSKYHSLLRKIRHYWENDLLSLGQEKYMLSLNSSFYQKVIKYS